VIASKIRRMLESRAEDLATGKQGGRPADAAAGDEPRAEIWFKRRVGFQQALRELWEFRGLIRALAERDLRIRYKQATLGIAWAVVTPIVMMLAFTLVFTKFGHVQTGGIPYPLFSYVGLIPWTFFSASVLIGSASLSTNTSLLNKLYCPREIFPIGTIVVAAVDSLLSSLVLLALFPIERYTPAAQMYYLPVMFLILVAFTTGVTLAVSTITVYMRDLRLAVPLVIQLGLFVTPVAYGASAVAKSRTDLLIYSALNPLVPVIEGLRDTMLEGNSPDWAMQLVGATSAVLFLLGGFTVFKRLETGLADVA
jgi:ABC-2 type transport system permease protein/lipopolysaccharide transport system permease protein